jgi:fibrillarin-like rRNA methylase
VSGGLFRWRLVKMAQQSEQQLRHLLEEVRVLTEQMSQPNQSNVSAEVSRVFGYSQGFHFFCHELL